MKALFSQFFSAKLYDRLLILLLPIIAVCGALLVGAVLLWLIGANPIEGYKTLVTKATGTASYEEIKIPDPARRELSVKLSRLNDRSETLVKAIPMMFVGIGICIAFRGGVVNVGGEGQMIMGAVAGTAVALYWKNWPVIFFQDIQDMPQIAIVGAALLAGFAAGALWSGIAGFLKAYLNVNEILSTIMLNQVAFWIMVYLLNGVMQDPAQQTGSGGGIAKTVRVPDNAQLPRLTWFIDERARTSLHYGLVIAVVLAVLIYILLWRTTLGYRIRAVGKSERAARYAGIKVKRQMLYAMLWAGGFAGLAGVVQVIGSRFVLQTEGTLTDFTDNAGFNGIVAALFGGLHPIGTLFAAVLFGGLLTGGKAMQRTLQIEATAPLITTLNGLVVIFVISSQIFVKRRSRRLVNIPPTPSSETKEAANV